MANDLKYGVSLYCFSNSFHTRQLDLEGCIKRAKEIGYNGATIVAAQSCEEYPFPSDKWLFKLRDTMEKYEMEPKAIWMSACAMTGICHLRRSGSSQETTLSMPIKPASI